MLSTYDGYLSLARGLTASVARVGKQASVQREASYYRANIGKVKSVDGFIADAALYNYAMASFGLQDAIPYRAFIRKVLTGDLTKAKSFADKPSDGRYRTMGAAFAFASSGKTLSTASGQDIAQENETLGLYGRQSFAGMDEAGDLAYYQSHIARVAST